MKILLSSLDQSSDLQAIGTVFQSKRAPTIVLQTRRETLTVSGHHRFDVVLFLEDLAAAFLTIAANEGPLTYHVQRERLGKPVYWNDLDAPIKLAIGTLVIGIWAKPAAKGPPVAIGACLWQSAFIGMRVDFLSLRFFAEQLGNELDQRYG